MTSKKPSVFYILHFSYAGLLVLISKGKETHTMTINEAAEILHKNPQALRLAFQRNELSRLGMAYRNQSDTGWRYLVNENEVLKFRRKETNDESI